jgi:drug/metabolite transporter (DMT)-like permease
VNTTDLLGFAGVALILIAYFLNLNQRLAANDLRYILMNLVGAILACLASVLMKYYPFVLLEGTWAMVSLVALVKKLKDATKT